MKLIKKVLSRIGSSSLKQEIDELKILTGNHLARIAANAESMQKAEFKVFSQWGDDGIIQFLTNKIDISNQYFVEFGVENYAEATTRFLLINNNWDGLVMDGSAANVDFIKNDAIYMKFGLTAKHAFITSENINILLDEENVPNRIGIFHIDIDGNDYWIWKNLKRVVADIVIVEYNSVFGSTRSITVPYQDNFNRTKAHYSNLYYGASLSALCDLAKEKGYTFVGCNSAGNNAYFVLNDKLGMLKSLTAEEGFVRSKFKESRNKEGNLTFLMPGIREKVIETLDIYNTRTNKIEKI